MATITLDMLPDPALVVDEGGQIVGYNSQAMALFGYGSMDGMRVEDLIPAGMRDRHLEHRARYNQAPRQRPMSTGGLLTAQKASGEQAFVEISLGPLGDGQTIAIIRDATQRIQAEQEYRATRTQLIDTQAVMIQVLTEDLRGLAARVGVLEEAWRAEAG